MRMASNVPPRLIAPSHSLSRPRPVTASWFCARALMSNPHIIGGAVASARSAGRLISRTLSRGTAAVAVAWPSRKALRTRSTSPEISPLPPSDRMVSGPVTVADTSSRRISSALVAVAEISIPKPRAAARSKAARPTKVPRPALAVKLSMTSFDPPKFPRA